MSASTPTEQPCAQCGDWLPDDGICTTCGARNTIAPPSSPREDSVLIQREDYDDDDLVDGEPDDYYSESDLDYFADRAADRYERWLCGE